MQTKALRIACFVLGVCILSLTEADGSLSTNEPVYRGKPLGYWIRDESHGSMNLSRPDLGVDGVEAVRAAGTNANPFLLEWLGSSHTVLAFGVLGSSARSAIPELLRLATKETRVANAQGSFQTNAIIALWQIGSEAVPALSQIATNHTAKPARHIALSVIALMGTNASAAKPALLESLNDPDENIVSTALLGLRLMHCHDPSAFVSVTTILKRQQPRLRRDALEVLAEFGDQAHPIIIGALDDADNDVRTTAFEVLLRVAPHVFTNSSVLAIAAHDLGSQDNARQIWAAKVIWAAGQHAQGRTADLRDWVRRPPGSMLEDATNTLRRVAPDLLEHSAK